MFVRFRVTAYGLAMSLVETRRENGKVRHEHVSSLGSVETPLTVAGRIEFWGRLHERLARLSNRLDSETQSKVLGAVHARVPMPTADEQRGLQLENAKTDADQWEWIHGTHAAMVQDHKGLAAMVADKIAEGETCAAEAAAKAKVARERVEGIERGENVEGGLGEPLDAKNVEKILRAAGYTTSDLRHARVLAELPEESLKKLSEARMVAAERAERRAARKMLFAQRSVEGADDPDAP